MERPSVTPEGVELWETSDQGCDIMLRHLEAARDVANYSHDYTANAEKILQGERTKKTFHCQQPMTSTSCNAPNLPLARADCADFQCDEDLLEVFRTDFQLRLLWGSRGASVNQPDRYSKFNLILTALSRKLEPPAKTQTLI